MDKAAVGPQASSSQVAAEQSLPPTSVANPTAKRNRAPKSTKAKESSRGFVQQNTQVVVVSPPSYSMTTASTSMVRLCLCGEYVDVPSALINDENVFRAVLCKSSFRSLPEAAQNYLKRLLPSFEGVQNMDEQEKSLDCAFSNNINLSFTNSLSNIFQKIKGGYFSGQNLSEEVQLRSYRRVLYDHYIRNYYVKLLKKVMINRQIILENASKMGAQESNLLERRSFSYYSKRKIKNAQQLALRASVRARRIIDDCKARASSNADMLSSDECDEEDLVSIKPTRLAPGAQSTLYSKKFSVYDLDLHQPIGMKSTGELIKEYRHLCEIEPNCPSCEISDICMEDVYERAGVSFQSERNFAFALAERSNGATHSSPASRVNGRPLQNGVRNVELSDAI